MLEHLPRGHYGAITADPPWAFKVWAKDTGHGRSAEAHYQTMDLDDIKALPVYDVAAKDSFLFLWATSPQLPEAIDVIRAWGFTYKTLGFCWVKLLKRWQLRLPKLIAIGLAYIDRLFHFGMGYYTRSNVELCLLATKGKPKRRSAKVRQLIVSPIREHSRKPDEIYGRVEEFCEGP